MYFVYETKENKWMKVMEKNNSKEKVKRRKGLEEEISRLRCHKFQQVVFETLLRSKENERKRSEDEEDEKHFELPTEIGVSLNLSKKHLQEFPEELLNKIGKVQYLYLEGNKLLELPKTFFQNLTSIKWLDLRNNYLTELPVSGLKNHPTLEVILLQGNRIRNLPTELATVSSLKGLQTTGNPIVNIPQEVMAEGFKGVISHLEKLRSQTDVVLPVPETFVVKPTASQSKTTELSNAPTESELRMWDLEKLSQWQHFMKKKQKLRRPKVFTKRNMNQKLSQDTAKISVSVKSHSNVASRPIPFRCGAYNRNHQKTVRMRKTRLGYKRKPITATMIQDKIRKEAQKAQLREFLEKQARKIQRMRDKEVLKSWREHSRLSLEQIKLLDNFQEYPTKDFASKSPFDINPEFMKMLSRVDIYRSLKDIDEKAKKIKSPKVRVSVFDLEKQMAEIMNKLQQLDTNEDEEVTSPRTKQSHVCHKMSKILNIQKTLKKLTTLNSTLIGVTPVVEAKNTKTI